MVYYTGYEEATRNTAGGKAAKEYWADDSKPLFYDSMSLVATEAIKEDVKRAIKVFQKIK